jgi:hypothetical protein
MLWRHQSRRMRSATLPVYLACGEVSQPFYWLLYGGMVRLGLTKHGPGVDRRLSRTSPTGATVAGAEAAERVAR